MIRTFRDADASALAAVIRDAAPHWVTTEAGLRHRLRDPGARTRRGDWVADVDGEIVGWSSGGLDVESRRADVAFIRVLVRSADRGHGVGSALYEQAEAHVLGLGARRLLAEAGDDLAGRAFAERRGFRHTMTRRLSRLDPTAADGEELRRLAAEKEADGFTIAPFSVFRDTPELIHTVDAEASLDEPLDEPLADVPLDLWLERYWRQPDLSLEGSYAVVLEGRPVAIAELHVDLDGRRAANGFTGTMRSCRGRGLARLAKLASIAWLREQGVTTLVTENDETNAPMLAINSRLGYRPYGARLTYVRDDA